MQRSDDNGKPRATLPEDWEDTAGCLWTLLAMTASVVVILLLLALAVMAWVEVF